MKILAFESSCDETAVAVVEDGRRVLTDQIFSQADLHAVYGGVVPEIASRSHVEVISMLSERAIQVAGIKKSVTFATHLGIVLWCNGSTSDSGSACEGSNPSRTTT